MYNINNLIGRIGDFHFTIGSQTFDITGALQDKDRHIVLNARITEEIFRQLRFCNVSQIWGNIEGICVTLLGCYISRSCRYTRDSLYGSLVANPAEIIVGRSYSHDIKLTKICASISALNFMFSKMPFEDTFTFSKENPAILNFTAPCEISAIDKDGQIRLTLGLSCSHTWGKVEYSSVPNLEYSFYKPTSVQEAIAKIASVRNLFSFFADYYLPLENISFADEKTNALENSVVICDCLIHMNNAEDIESPKTPFLITTDCFSHNFPQIWTNWLQFYNDSKFIPTLFYEIICNRSTRINRFLNLSQSIEIYSSYYRQKNAKALALQNGCKFKNIPLRYRMEDIMLYLLEYLDIDSEKVTILAKIISDIRNFFTHYNKKNYQEPSFQELVSANILLRYILLVIVYKTTGVEQQYISECRHHSDYCHLADDISLLLKYNN